MHKSDGNYPKDALHMYEEDEPAIKRNDAVLNDLPGELYTIESDDKILDNCKYPLATTQVAHNQKQTNTGGSVKLLKLKICEKVMLTVNLDTQDCLINDKTGNICDIEFAQGSAQKVYVNLSDEQTSLKAVRPFYLT